MEDVISREGVPTYAYTGPLGPSGCVLTLAWPEKDLEVEYISMDNGKPCNALNAGKKISERLQVTEILYEDKSRTEPCDFSGIQCMAWPGFDQGDG